MNVTGANDGITEFFVYGTLKRGQCRQFCWPRAPRNVVSAFVRGSLVDLGAYPGLLSGHQWVAGEIWSFLPDDVPPVIECLDQIEGFRPNRSRNLYVRRVVPWFQDSADSACSGEAYTYFYDQMHSELNSRVAAGAQVGWPYEDG